MSQEEGEDEIGSREYRVLRMGFDSHSVGGLVSSLNE